jgi:ABC-2 type transport system ATP-binding protein
MTDAVIDISGLTKSFGRKHVLDGVELSVPKGTVYGFLGLNGAGKTTTIRVLLGLLRPDGGTCRVAGTDPVRDPVETRRRVGYMAENQAMYGWMRVREIIAWCGRFYPTWDTQLAEELREQMSLAGDQKVGALSKGQTSKLALLLALAHRPELVILDDPVLGLDPLARRDFLREVIGQLQAREVTVFFSSHLLYEIEPICDRVAILHGGRIIASESVDALRERVKRVELRLRAGARIEGVPTLLDARPEGERWSLVVGDIEEARRPLEEVSSNGIATDDLNLDEIFEAYVAGRKEQPA